MGSAAACPWYTGRTREAEPRLRDCPGGSTILCTTVHCCTVTVHIAAVYCAVWGALLPLVADPYYSAGGWGRTRGRAQHSPHCCLEVGIPAARRRCGGLRRRKSGPWKYQAHPGLQLLVLPLLLLLLLLMLVLVVVVVLLLLPLPLLLRSALLVVRQTE